MLSLRSSNSQEPKSGRNVLYFKVGFPGLKGKESAEKQVSPLPWVHRTKRGGSKSRFSLVRGPASVPMWQDPANSAKFVAKNSKKSILLREEADFREKAGLPSYWGLGGLDIFAKCGRVSTIFRQNDVEIHSG